MSSFSVLGHSLVIYRWHNVISQCKCNAWQVQLTASVAKRVVKYAGMLFRVCGRVPSYETDDRDKEYIV